MDQKRLNLYTVDIKYVRNLHNQGDDHVFSVSPQTGKADRPFVGIVIICDDKQYCVPLSSPKEKHKKNEPHLRDMYDLDISGSTIIQVTDKILQCPLRYPNELNHLVNSHQSSILLLSHVITSRTVKHLKLRRINDYSNSI